MCSALCATEPRSIGSTSASIVRGEMTRSKSHAEEQSANRSSSVTPNVVLAPYTRVQRLAPQARLAPQRGTRARKPPLPAVRLREHDRRVRVGRGEQRERTQPLALGRRALERPRQRGERPPRRRAGDVVAVEDGRDLLPERARLARRPLVGRRLAHEVQPPNGARARGVEEVPVARDLVRALEPAAQLASPIVVEERRGARPARQRPFLEAEDEHDLEAARPRAHQVEHRDTAGLAGGREPYLAALERGDHLVAGRVEPTELRQQLQHMAVRTQVEARAVAGRRSVGPVRGAQHRPQLHANRLDGILGGAKLCERRNRRLPQLLGLLLDARRRMDRPAAQTTLDVVDGRAPKTGIRAAQEREELAPARVPPRVPQELEQRVADRRRAEPHPRLDRVRHVERSEHGLERAAPGVDRRRDERDLLRADTGANELEQLVTDELERAARACTLEEAHGVVERRRCRRRLVEERPLEMCERLMLVLARARRAAPRTFPDASAARSVGGTRKRSESDAARLVRQRDLDVRASGERFEQRPLRTRQILEPIREHRLAVPRRELRRKPLGGATAEEVAVPQRRAGRAPSGRGRTGRRGRRRGRPGRAAPARARRASGAACRRSRRWRPTARARSAERFGGARRTISARSASLSTRRAAGSSRASRRNRSSNVPIVAAEEAAAAREQVPLDAVDVRRVRHDQCRFVGEARQIALEKQRDLARVRRPCEQGESHLPIVGLSSDGQAGEIGANRENPRPAGSDLAGGGGLRPPAPASGRAARHLARAVVAEIGNLRPAAGVDVGDAQRRAARLVDFVAAVVADKNCFPCHSAEFTRQRARTEFLSRIRVRLVARLGRRCG